LAHVPATLLPDELTTLHAWPSGLPLHAAAPALQTRPLPSARHTSVPLTWQTPWRPLLQGLPLFGKSSSIFVSQSSSRPLHSSARDAPAMISDTASSTPDWSAA